MKIERPQNVVVALEDVLNASAIYCGLPRLENEDEDGFEINKSERRVQLVVHLETLLQNVNWWTVIETVAWKAVQGGAIEYILGAIPVDAAVAYYGLPRVLYELKADSKQREIVKYLGIKETLDACLREFGDSAVLDALGEDLTEALARARAAARKKDKAVSENEPERDITGKFKPKEGPTP